MPKLLIIDAFTLLICKKSVEIFALLRCKIFSLKIWVCKIFDKFHVCTTSRDFYIGGSARCQLGDRGMHLAEKCDQDTLAIPYCHFQPEIRFRYQVTRKPPQNARSESGYGGVGLLLFQPGHKMAQIGSGLQSWKRLFQLKSPYESFSDVGESRVWFASKNLTPCRMH